MLSFNFLVVSSCILFVLYFKPFTACFSAQIKHKIGKNINFVQQRCEHHH